MRVGVPREIKANENRVGLVPAGVRELTARGHEVVVETGAARGIGLGDDDYRAAGAEIVADAAAVFEGARMIVKVKEPQPGECAMLRPDQVLFTYLHLAADPEQTEGLRRSGCVAVAYETITDAAGRLPLLAPMSEVAGRMAVQVGAAIVDVAVDQGGCCETTRPTTHAEPTFVVGGVVHYCVANMPGGVARTSTFALTNATLPYVLTLADHGWHRALADDPHFQSGLNVCQGRVTLEAVARDLALDYTPAETCLAEAA